MKNNYFKPLLVLTFLAFNLLSAQTYTIDASGTNNCNGSGSIDDAFICLSDGSNAALGTFTDTNTPGVVLESISLDVYDACNGDFEVFLNGVSLGTATASGVSCACETIADTPGITNTISPTLTQQIIDAYVVDGENTLSITTSTSDFGTQCFYGAMVTVTTSTLSISEFSANSYSLHPNPATTFIYVSGLQHVSPYRIVSLQGQVIQEGGTSQDNPIDIAHLAKGLYFLQIESNSLRFVKQ